jgi:WD40 repeat protein
LNGKKIYANGAARAAAPDQPKLKLDLRPGKNTLLLKICQLKGEWAFYFADKSNLPQRGGMFSGDASLAITTSGDQKAYVWDVATGTIYQRLDGHTEKADACVITADGLHAVTSAADRTVRLWGIQAR